MARVEYSERFESLWSQVWRRVGKCAAFKEWQKLDEEDRAQALEVVAAHALHYAGNDLQFRPHLRTWLHQRRYEDELGDPMAEQRAQRARQQAAYEMGWGEMVQ